MPRFSLTFLFNLKVIIPDIGIKKLVEDGFLPSGLKIGPSSVDLTLSDSFSWPEPVKNTITLGEAVPHKHVKKDEFVLEPNHFVLASTAESIRVPHDMAAYVEGRSIFWKIWRSMRSYTKSFRSGSGIFINLFFARKFILVFLA